MDKQKLLPRQEPGPIIAALTQEGAGDVGQGSPLNIEKLRYIWVANLLTERETLLQRLASVDKTLIALGYRVATPRRFRGPQNDAQASGGS